MLYLIEELVLRSITILGLIRTVCLSLVSSYDGGVSSTQFTNNNQDHCGLFIEFASPL